MGDTLDDYRKKRDFGKTPEPEPSPPPDGEGARYVVHRHDASRLHYDLRLEMEGVLRSWAVPKGFSYDPADKHLAVRTEDHPMEYEHFSGVIPKGQYGAGTMTIWDRGSYRVVKATSGPEAVAAGELKVVLDGRKLRGEWHLVKTKQAENTWLLFKTRDRYAGTPRDSATGVDLTAAPRAPLPEDVSPMEVGAARGPFTDPAWLFEAAFEGVRAFLVKEGEAVRLRGLKDVPALLREEALTMRAESALLDGVLVAVDERGRPDAALARARLDGSEEGLLAYYAFDLLYFDAFDLRPLPTVDRKAALRAVLPAGATSLLLLDHVPGNGEDLCGVVAAAGLPAVIARRAGAPYVPGPSGDVVRIDLAPDATLASRSVGERIARRGSGTGSRVRITNPGKVFWPAEGFTKGDLVAYYDAVADVLLPYLAERPLHLHRYPDGIEGKSFYQKNAGDLLPPWVEREPVRSSAREEPIEYVICNDRDTLLALANSGSIDLHPWMSRRGHLDEPDYAVIDLDPKDAPFTDVVEIARHVGGILRTVGLRPLLKTSGATGLHIHIPLAEGYSYDQARMFCEGIARLVARDLPEIATVERVVGRRDGKVYVDYGQNRRGQTIVPPYVPRPVRGATVSAPLLWEELDRDLKPAHFTIQTLPPRLERRGDLFAALLTDRQDLLPAIEALGPLI